MEPDALDVGSAGTSQVDGDQNSSSWRLDPSKRMGHPGVEDFRQKSMFYGQMFQVPATHPKGVTASGHLDVVAEEDEVPNVPFFQTDEKISVKVSLSGL